MNILQEKNSPQGSVCIFSQCQMTSLGLQGLLPRGTKVIPSLQHINMRPSELEGIHFLYFLPHEPHFLFDGIKQISELLTQSGIPLKIVIFSRVQSSWILNTLKNQVRKGYLIKYVHIVLSHSPCGLISPLIHSFLFNNLPLTSNNINSTSEKIYSGLTREEFETMRNILNGYSIPVLAKLKKKSSGTLHAQKLSAARKMPFALPDMKWSRVFNTVNYKKHTSMS